LARENGNKIILWYRCNKNLLSAYLQAEAKEREKQFLR
jgi:hypothetical protein